MSDLYKNFAYCTTTAAITSNTQTTVTVDDVSRLPTNAQLAASDFYMTLESTLAANAFEIVKVTSKVTSGSISDTFDRSNGLVTAGQTGYDSSTTAHIVSNKATASTNTEQIALVYNGGDFDLTVDVVVTGSDGFYVVPGTGAAASMVFETTDKVSFRSRVDNSLLFSSGSGSLSGISSGTFRFRISGTVWTISRNGSVLLTHDFGANARTGPATITLFTDHTVDNLVYVDTASSLTIVRGQESTTAQSSIASGTVMKASLTAAMVSRLTVQGIPTVSRPQGTQQRQYTFDSSTQSWTVDAAATLSVSSGRLLFAKSSNNTDSAALEPSGVSNVADGEVYADYLGITSSTATNNGVDQVGVIFRATDANNHYMVLISLGVPTSVVRWISLWKRVSGTYTALASTPTGTTAVPPINLSRDQAQRIMVRYVGSAVSVYLNETLVLEAVDTTYTTGRVGLYAATQASYLFDNVTVLSLPSTWTPALYTPVAAAGDSSWTALTPNSTWSNLGSPYAPISCRKDAMGFVHLEGAVTAGGGFGPVLITTLPAGYRPGHTIRPPATFYLSGSFSSAGTVTITTAGAVSLDSAGTGSVNNAALDGITFFAEN